MSIDADPHPLKVKLFADGADLAGIVALAANPWIKGFTTNPTLMRKAGITDYAGFARQVLAAVPDRPVSFEVFADDFPTMAAQARTIARWGSQVNVKIPITNSLGAPSYDLIGELSRAGIYVNVTALMTLEQVRALTHVLDPNSPALVSIFAGRIADTGRDPIPIMAKAVEMLSPLPKAEMIWASPREVLNLFQADQVGCHIITATPDILAKLALRGKDLHAYSLETVRMFRTDALAAGFAIDLDG